jgi:uncharacterized repeat protein (TIGR03837 family)
MSLDKVTLPHPATTLALFCKVIDNYGDIGICWRLARQLQHEHGIAVTLWVDDLASFRRICPEIAIDVDLQQVLGVTVRHWRDQTEAFSVLDVADIVIEFFGCDIPPAYIVAMAQCTPRPVWLNLEGLSAEEWVEGCHRLPSPHPRLPLTKHFFFPGFTEKTGGLLLEASLDERRRQFRADPAAISAFLTPLGVTEAEMASLKVSLFCYPQAPATALFDAWQGGEAAITCLVPEGVAGEAVAAFLGVAATAGAARTRGALTVRVVPFVSQQDYDLLLWACDINFVRGEDSFVRAQWAGKPFIWHIYPQDENLHHVKLRAFLQRHVPDIDSASRLSLLWNDAIADASATPANWRLAWSQFAAEIPFMDARSVNWQREMRENGDLAANLLKFSCSLRQ